jgi:hypothetical protein
MVANGMMEGGTVSVTMKGTEPHFEVKKGQARRVTKKEREALGV